MKATGTLIALLAGFAFCSARQATTREEIRANQRLDGRSPHASTGVEEPRLLLTGEYGSSFSSSSMKAFKAKLKSNHVNSFLQHRRIQKSVFGPVPIKTVEKSSGKGNDKSGGKSGGKSGSLSGIQGGKSVGGKSVGKSGSLSGSKSAGKGTTLVFGVKATVPVLTGKGNGGKQEGKGNSSLATSKRSSKGTKATVPVPTGKGKGGKQEGKGGKQEGKGGKQEGKGNSLATSKRSSKGTSTLSKMSKSSKKQNEFCRDLTFTDRRRLQNGGKDCSPNILGVARQNPDLSIFVDLIERAGMEAIFNCPGKTAVDFCAGDADNV